tara:strand:- start:2 stop:457 length:456 start_codon:yes stop_codon:yes gene_type:complete
MKNTIVAVLVIAIFGILCYSQLPSSVEEEPIFYSDLTTIEHEYADQVEEVFEEVVKDIVELEDVELTEDIVDGASDLTFGDAFREARMLMGSGETFFYRGYEYTTDYLEEVIDKSRKIVKLYDGDMVEIIANNHKADSADVASDHILEQAP